MWGPTCDGLDQVVSSVLLPPLDIGDWLVFPDMGAYTLPVASTFNGFPVPKVHAVIDESLWLVINPGKLFLLLPAVLYYDREMKGSWQEWDAQ